MRKSVTRVLLTVVAVLLVPIISYAAGLGKMTVRSALGQPLDAEIEIVSLQPGEDESFVARLASRDAFRDAGLEYSPVLGGARFSIERQASGKSVVRIRTTQPVNDPILSVMVELQWPNGRLAREYTVLVDPVEYKSTQAVAAAQGSAQRPAASAVSSQAASTAGAATLAPAVATAPKQGPTSVSRETSKANLVPAQAAVAPQAITPSQPSGPAAVPAKSAAERTQEQVATSTVPVTTQAPVAPVAQNARAESARPESAAISPAPAAAPSAGPVPATTQPAARSSAQAPATVSVAATAPSVVRSSDQAHATAKAATQEVAIATQPLQTARRKAAKAAMIAETPAREHRIAGTYQVRKGDTLGTIARKWKPAGVTLNQMLIALYEGNRHVFIRDNINLIRAGEILTIPERGQAAEIDAASALRQVRSQMLEFARYRRHHEGMFTAASLRTMTGAREGTTRRAAVRRGARAL